jgi:hypothetical protein
MLKKLARSKFVVISTVLAAVLASVSATSVFAASAGVPAANHELKSVWGNQYRDLTEDRIAYDHFKSERNTSSSPAEFQQYLDQYAAALSRADAIIMLSSSPSSTTSVKINNHFDASRTAQQDLAVYLHMMRGLRQKLGGL